MARPEPPPRPRPRHSYEGFVEKRGPRDQGYRRVWAGLRGATLAFYRGPRDCEPLEVLDLGELVAVRAEGGGLVLRLRGREVTLKAESCEAQEMWRGFILTMAEMKVPADLALLPGHVFQLSEALRQEQSRRAAPASPSPPRPPRVPSCFFEVSRLEAEQLLQRSAGGGNMVLRPGGHGRGVSVTTRQEMNGTVLLKHYKVNRVDQGYVIAVDTPHRCSSLAEVVQYFVESSKGSLQPLHREYSPQLEFVELDGENGEEAQGVCEPPPAAPQRRGLSAPKPPPSPHRPALQPPGGPRGPPPFGGTQEEQTHVNEQGERDPQGLGPRPATRRALLPPHNPGMAEELAQKLQLRRALMED
ncbi:LOW QUALITY PROTEIN: signal-transducing adaptor protein 2 [Pelecanus crispus]|uniref:LOW QUALITY PROTEIN: signal-transducing adaptor protein 2 n=1 Tax=Pelecanus crispus TaxID=36300 RepID=UPI003F5D39AE